MARQSGRFDGRYFAAIAVDYMHNEKTRDLPATTKLLDLASVLLSTELSTDGLLNEDMAVANAGIGVKKADANRLVTQGRWHRPGYSCKDCTATIPTGYVYIHDYLKHQPGKGERDDLRQKRSMAGVAGNHSKYGHPGPLEQCDICMRPAPLRLAK